MKRVLIMALAVAFPLSALADVLYEQAPINPIDGWGSDGNSTAGTQAWHQTIADNFTLGGASNVTKITFWGASDAFVSDDLSNFDSYDIAIMDSSFNTVFSTNVAQASLSPALTGAVGNFVGSQYVFTFNTNINLAGGSYFLNIGSKNADPDGNGWTWNAAQTDGVLAGNVFDGGGWFVEDPLNVDVDVAFRLEGTRTVPEPATLSALGLGALALLRRRRK